MDITAILQKMAAIANGDLHDIEHFVKVSAYARAIALAEGLSPAEQFTVEAAAIVHDIACPLCRAKYGSAPGKKQETEGMPLTEEFLEDFDIDESIKERIIWLVGHHHTHAPVDGIDHQILLEADFLVNASESRMSRAAIQECRERMFRTAYGTALLNDIYLKDSRVEIRPARADDLTAIAGIFDAIHTEEEAGRAVIGWDRAIYPTAATAREALLAGDLYVLTENDRVAGAARINRAQVPVYDEANWSIPADDTLVMVLHTLGIDPRCGGKGFGKRFVAFYERTAREQGCRVLRMDTNEKNAAARALYKKLGYREADIVPCQFNGIPGVNLVCLEKEL